MSKELNCKVKRNTAIDSAKGIAVLGVFIVHCGTVAFPKYGGWFSYGQYGVELFLLLNGYLAYHKYHEKGIDNVFLFLMKRYLRVIPILWLNMGITCLMNLIRFDEPFASISIFLYNNPYANAGSVISTMFMVNFLLPSWGFFSLFTCVYSVVNLIFAFLIFLQKKYMHIKSNILTYSTVIIWTISMIANFTLPKFQMLMEEDVFYYIQYNVRGVQAFAAGGLVYYICRILKDVHFKFKKPFFYIISIVAIIYAAFECWYSVSWNSASFILFAIVLMVCLMNEHNIVLDNKLWCFVGKYSWAFYFIHPIVFYLLLGMCSGWILLLLSFGSSLLLSCIVSEIYEKPIIAFWNKKMKTRNVNQR